MPSTRQVLRLGIDAMGGDSAPASVLRSLRTASERHPDAQFHLYGDAAKLESLVAELRLDASSIEIHHFPRALSASDGPRELLNRDAPSSMAAAIMAQQRGETDAVVSAGSTAALLALGKHHLQTFDTVERPAITSFIPTLRNETVLLDLGANLNCSARHLSQFAAMGSAFSQSVLAIQEPRVSLLNVGSEREKGTEVLRDAANYIEQMPLPGKFQGFIEGNDLGKGEVDVIVTDGFTGNVALKVMEGTAQMISGYTHRSFTNSHTAKIGYFFASRQFRKLRKRLDPRRYNGAIMLGLNGILVKSHGGADALAFANAIDIAADLVEHGVLERMERYLSVD